MKQSRIKGVRKGNNQHNSLSDNLTSTSQSDMAKCIMELERIKGIKVGKPSNSEIISEYKTQKDLAIEIGTDVNFPY